MSVKFRCATRGAPISRNWPILAQIGSDRVQQMIVLADLRGQFCQIGKVVGVKQLKNVWVGSHLNLISV